MRVLVAFLALLALAACRSEPQPEALSLLGIPLYSPAPAPERRAALEAELAAAEAAYRASPADLDAIVWYGRRLAYLGRYRAAIAVYTRGLERYPKSAVLLRHRGQRWITLRRFQSAIADLRRAQRLAARAPDEVEPDGAPNASGTPRSTLKSSIWYHLGLAHYLDQDRPNALRVLRAGVDHAHNADTLVANLYWLYLTLRRLGRDQEARELLASIDFDMEILENDAYHRLLLAFKGELAPDDLLDVSGSGPIDDATLGYGLATWYLCAGDRVRAGKLWKRVLAGSNWMSFGYVATEADAAALGAFVYRPNGK